MHRRYRTLDSLRGIAAASVMLRHALLAGGLPAPPAQWAVMLFFVLSGFVLAQPWTAGRPPVWGAFVLRRICRLWPPVLAATALSAALYLAVGAAPPFISATWAEPLSAGLATRCLLLTGQHGGCTLDVPTWSLVFEARAALLFPLIATYAMRRPAVTAAVAVLWAVPIDLRGQMLGADGLMPGIVLTGHFVGIVALGAVLALQGRPLIRWLRPATALPVAAVLAVVPSDTAEAVGGVLVIALALGSPRFGRLLMLRPLPWLGQISYSLYLVHWPVIMAVYYGSGGRLGAAGIGMALAASLALAYGMNRLIERPAMRAGRRLTRPA